MSYQDEQDKLRREAEADINAAQASVENAEQQRAKIKEASQQLKDKMVKQEVNRKEMEIKRVESSVKGMDLAENRTRRELGIKRGKLKRSDEKHIREEAGTLRKRSGEEERLARLKKELGSMKGGSGSGGSTLRPPGGGLIR